MNLNKVNYSSPTFYALQNNDFEYVRNHWSEYEDAKNDWLHVASCYSDVPINKLFIDNGANPLDNNCENFFNAVYQNNINLVKFYVNLNCYSLIKEDFLGGPLTDAFSKDNLELLIYLLELGCDIHLDNDYAFNRGFAHNAQKCISYILQNYDKYPVKYNPYESYNHQEMINHNYYELCHFMLSHFHHPLEFNFDSYLSHLFYYGKPEMFDVFFQHGLLSKEKFLIFYPQLLLNFSSQQELYHHLKKNYTELLIEAENINIQSQIEEKISFILPDITFLKNRNINQEIERIISFQFTSPNSQYPITIELFQDLLKIPLFNKFRNNNELLLSYVLENIEKGNNISFFKYFLTPNIFENEILLDKIVLKLKKHINDDFINDFMNIVFTDYQKIGHHELDKIFIYYKAINQPSNHYIKKSKI